MKSKIDYVIVYINKYLSSLPTRLLFIITLYPILCLMLGIFMLFGETESVYEDSL